MDEDTQSAEEDADATGAGSRERSTISFPYTPLRDAEAVAGQLQQKWPGHASPEQLASTMDQTPTSGTFRTKVATARIFGAVNVTRGRIELTDLGKRLVDPRTRDHARVAAFLHVPLFSKIYENHKTGLLPDDQGLEAEIVQLGVSQKQADRARQAFQRSAEQAGFHKNAKDRLVMPATTEINRHQDDPDRGDHQNEKPLSGAATMVAAEVAAWTTLLDEGENWTADEIVEWVNLARRQRAIRSRKRA